MTHHKTITNLCCSFDFNAKPSAQSEQFIFAKELQILILCFLGNTKIDHIAQTMLKNKILQKMKQNKSGIISCSNIVILPRSFIKHVPFSFM